MERKKKCDLFEGYACIVTMPKHVVETMYKAVYLSWILVAHKHKHMSIFKCQFAI